MSTPDEKTPAPRERRRAARRDEILAVAWELARRDGITGISLRELADRVDLRQPSLYSYFESKAALYDAMFAQGFQELVDQRERLVLDPDPVAALQQGCRHFVQFCVDDPVRYQLLFQHSIPGFHPSDTSMQTSGRALDFLQRWLAAAGVDDPAGLDLIRAVLLGISGEQIANEPHGERWTRFTDELVGAALEVARRRTGGARNARQSRKKEERLARDNRSRAPRKSERR